jgi:hypothetical protein
MQLVVFVGLAVPQKQLNPLKVRIKCVSPDQFEKWENYCSGFYQDNNLSKLA